jgi:hypothetical protein
VHDGFTLAVLCAQVGIVEDINHEVFHSLLESQESCALHLQATYSGHVLYNLTYKVLEGGFPDEEICCFLELTVSLAATIPGCQRQGFLTAIAFSAAAHAAFVAK